MRCSPLPPRSPLALTAALAAALTACPGGTQGLGDAARDVALDEPPAPDAAPEAAVYDPGPRPACDVPASAARLLDRPGGDRVAEPAALVAVEGGFLAATRVLVNDPAAPAGTVPRPTRDAIELFSLGPDGALRGQRTVFDAVPQGTQSDLPVLVPTPAGALLLFQESRANATAPDFLLQLRGLAVDAQGQGGALAVLRERYPRPAAAALRSNSVLAVASRFVAVTSGGVVSTEPVSLLLAPDGANARPQDVSINAFLPAEAEEPALRASDDGGARLLYRTGSRLGLLRFRPDGSLDARGALAVPGAQLARLDDAVAVHDAVVAVSSRIDGRTGEIRVVVASDEGALRSSAVLESFAVEEGAPAPTLARGYGGAVVLWPRGAGASARVRVAVVSPTGAVVLPPTDLVTGQDLYGRVAAVVQGRAVTAVVRNGTVSARWGWTLVRGCVPTP